MMPLARKQLLVSGGLAGAFAAYIASNSVEAGDALHAYPYDFQHKGHFSTYDHSSLRRGYEVYRQVCSTCHSMENVAFRQLIGVTHTEEQAKALAKSIEVWDAEPNEEGDMYQRPGKLTDTFPSPYRNAQEARFINGGAYPLDLTYVQKARHEGDDYIFALLTGYRQPPPGITLRQGLYYNPYFPGGAIAMPPPLNMEGVEWEDDTFPSISQQAKDVTTFLTWASQPEHDTRKKVGMMGCSMIAASLLIALYRKRFYWNLIKTRRISFID